MAMSLDMTFLHSLNPLSKSCLASGRTVSPKQKYPFSGFSKVIFQSALSLYDDPVPPVGLWYNMYVRKPAVVVINTRLTDLLRILSFLEAPAIPGNHCCQGF